MLAGVTVTIQVGANRNVERPNNTNRVGVTINALGLRGRLDGRLARSTPRSPASPPPAPRSARCRTASSTPIANLGVYQENLSAAESRIRDVDIAQEMVNFTRLQILSQSGTAMLAQANQAPQSVLSLLTARPHAPPPDRG